MPPHAVKELAPRLPKHRKGADIMIGSFTEYGRFEIVEATDPGRVDEPMAFSGLAIAEEADMLRNLKRWVDTYAGPYERGLIASGALTKGRRAERQNPALRLDTGMTVPHRAGDGSVVVAGIGAGHIGSL